LQYLELQLQENAMYDEGFEQLTLGLTRLEKLETLIVNFGFNDLRKQMGKLLEVAARKGLGNVRIGLSNNPLKDDEIKGALASIQGILNKCRAFELELLYTKIS
jgi:hypothetical protein